MGSQGHRKDLRLESDGTGFKSPTAVSQPCDLRPLSSVGSVGGGWAGWVRERKGKHRGIIVNI
jgi:hypothetical protein